MPDQHVSIDSTPGMESIDITGAEAVEVLIRADGRVVWVNTHIMRLRICQISGTVTVDDQRPSASGRVALRMVEGDQR